MKSNFASEVYGDMKHCMLKVGCVGTLLALAAGCGDRSKAAWSPTMENPPPVNLKYVGKDTPVADLKDDDVIVAVNGATLTKKEFYDRMKQVAWAIRRSPGMRANNFNDAYIYAGSTLIPRFVRETVVAQACRSEKLATEEEIRSKVDESVERFCEMHRVKREMLDKEFPGGLCAVQKDAERTAWVKIYAEHRGIKGKTITSETVTNILRQIAAENAAAAVSNRTIQAKLEWVRRDILSGKITFEKAADTYNEGLDRSNGGYWGEYTREGLPDSDLIFELEQDGISEVLEDSDSFYIVRLDKRTAAKRDSSKRLIAPESVALSRIQLFKHELTELASAGTLKEDLQAQMDEQALETKIEELMSKSMIVYPHGTNFWGGASKGGDE